MLSLQAPAVSRPRGRPAARLPPRFAIPFGSFFNRLVVPNPMPAPARAATVLELMHAHPRWELKKGVSGEVDTHGAHVAPARGARLRRHVSCQDKGHALLEALQQELYAQGEQARARARSCCGNTQSQRCRA